MRSKFCIIQSLRSKEISNDQPGGEVDAIAVGPVRRAAAGNVQHAWDAPSLVVGGRFLLMSISSWRLLWLQRNTS